MSEVGEKRHTCPLCKGEGLLPEGRVPVDILPERTRLVTGWEIAGDDLSFVPYDRTGLDGWLKENE